MSSKLTFEYLKVRNWFQGEEGQDVVEYALLMGLVAIAAVAGLTLAGTNILAWWNTLAARIAALAA